MPSRILNRALAIAIALASFVVGSPATAAPVSLRSFAQENLQVATIAYRISTQTAADCPDPQMVTGLLLHDLSLYDRSIRPAVARAFSLGSGIGITEVVAGSAADRAGLRTDDEILSVNGVSVEEPAAVDRPRRSYRRLEKFSRDLQRALRNGPAKLEIRRSGAVVNANLSGQPGCGGDLFLSSSRKRTAWSDGSQVVITTAMMKLARSDDELAFVVAHEMAHNILGHSKSARRGIFGLKFGGKREELAADYMAVWMMTEGGYKAEGGISFLRTVQRRLWWNISLDHPSFGRRIRTVAGAITSAANSPTWARAHPRLAATATVGDSLGGALACSGAGSAPCATSATEADRLPAAGASSRADRVQIVERVPHLPARPALIRTGDSLPVASGELEVTEEAAPGTLSVQPGEMALQTIGRNVQSIAPDVAALAPVQRSASPATLDPIHADAAMANGDLQIKAAVAGRPDSGCAQSRIETARGAEHGAWPRFSPAQALMLGPEPMQPNSVGATGAMPDQLVFGGSAFAASHSRGCEISVAQGGADIAAWH